MQLQLEDRQKPLFLQLADSLMDAILQGAFPEEGQIPSTTEISATYRINPATALKGINLLVERGMVYKRRGLGMFVSPGAQEKILRQRREDFPKDYVRPLLMEARRLRITDTELSDIIQRERIQ